MPEQINGWLPNGGAMAGSVAALMHGGVLGGVTLLVVMLAVAIKTAGPELRQWVVMVWARNDAKAENLLQRPAADADMPDAA